MEKARNVSLHVKLVAGAVPSSKNWIERFCDSLCLELGPTSLPPAAGTLTWTLRPAQARRTLERVAATGRATSALLELQEQIASIEMEGVQLYSQVSGVARQEVSSIIR